MNKLFQRQVHKILAIRTIKFGQALIYPEKDDNKNEFIFSLIKAQIWDDSLSYQARICNIHEVVLAEKIEYLFNEVNR